MRTRAWAMKTLNTQLASWTHLRHDSLLYTKQTYSDYAPCLYPRAFVEPRVEFWNRLGHMTAQAAEKIAEFSFEGTYPAVTNRPPAYDPVTGKETDPGGPVTNLVSLQVVQTRQVDHLRSFAVVASRLEHLSRKELAGEAFTADDDRFINGLMEDEVLHAGCVGPLAFSGWYPGLFYRTIYWNDWLEFHATFAAGANDALVADVHTDVPSAAPPDPGSVLHEAVAGPELLVIAVDSGADRFICAGPVLSHFEFEVLGEPRRITDEEWRGNGTFAREGLLQRVFPVDVATNRFEGLEPPVWTQCYQVPYIYVEQ